MRKKVLGLVMAALTISSIGAFAQNQTSDNKPACEQTSECHKGKKDGKCKKDGKKDGKKKGDRKHGDKVDGLNPFEGIQLTSEQQQKVDALKAERKAKMKAEKGKKEADKQAAKEARQQEKAQFDAQVAEILTPEQYTQYQSNCDSIKAKKQRMKAASKKYKKAHKGEFKGRDKSKEVQKAS